MSRIAPALKIHGGQHYFAPELVALMPKHTHYVEPFAGGLSVLLAKEPEGVSEVVNDIDSELMNFWSVLAKPELFSKFERIAQAIPFSEKLFEKAAAAVRSARLAEEEVNANVERAVAFFVFCRQSLAGRQKDFATLSRARTRRGMNEQASAWLSAVEGLAEVHFRLKRVVLLHSPAIKVIKVQDSVDTLFYLDPPYLPETRTAKNVYAHEMTMEQHVELLDLILQLKGKVMLSGYWSKLYAEKLVNWRHKVFQVSNNSGGGKAKNFRSAIVWMNYSEGS